MNERRDEPLSTADLASRGHRDEVDRLDADVAPAASPERAGDGVETTSAQQDRPPLFAEEDAAVLRGRWHDLQTGFVDEPRRAVQEADALVADLMQRLADTFAEERSQLERQWDRGDDVSTEDLRVALQRYRSFFDRLLTA